MGRSDWEWGRVSIEAASWKVEAYPAEAKLRKATTTKEICLKEKRKVDCYYWKVECFFLATKQYHSPKPNGDCFSSPFLQLFACLAIPHNLWTRTSGGVGCLGAGWGVGLLWGWGSEPPSVTLGGSHPSFPATPPLASLTQPLCSSGALLCPSLHLSLSPLLFSPASPYFSFSLPPPSPLSFLLSCRLAVPLLSPLHSPPLSPWLRWVTNVQ